MNNPSDNRYKMVEKTLKSFGYSKDSLIEALHSAQDSFGYLSDDVLIFIAKRLSLPISKVYSVATFYHYFRLKPKGKHSAVVCMGTACYIKGAKDILTALEKRFGVEVSHTTKDNLLTLMSARCVGSCSIAPVVVIDNKTVGKLSIDETLSQVEEVVKDDK
jgi:bidirectional [NiFe] hydrogenase diaphorase subunit